MASRGHSGGTFRSLGERFSALRMALRGRRRLRSPTRITRVRIVSWISAHAGATSSRARMSIRFRFDWIDAGPTSDSLARDTMATLSIEARDKVVTAVLDRRNKSYRHHVVVPLYHVAEWLIANWWHLWYEVADTGEQRPEFESRHNLAFAGDGFVLPNLYVIPASGRMHLRWTRSQPKYARIEFVDESETLVERTQLEQEFRTIIDAVLERIRGVGGHEHAVESLADAWGGSQRPGFG